MGEKPRPDSALVRFLLDTHHVRFLGKRIIRTYRSTTADGMRFMFHTRDGSERHLLEDIVDSHVYERFPIRQGDTVVDIGANIGIFTVMASRFVGKSGTVAAIEPSPSSFNLMKKNLSLNECENVKPVKTALGENESIGSLNVYNRSVFNSFLARNNQVLQHSVAVQIQTLDGLMQKLDLKRLDFLKIDTEGFELPILKGGVKTLLRFRPHIVGEAHPTFSDSGSKITRFLSDMGYRCQVEPLPYEAELFLADPGAQA
jgi:FkbM family methyltransferase